MLRGSQEVLSLPPQGAGGERPLKELSSTFDLPGPGQIPAGGAEKGRGRLEKRGWRHGGT